VNSYEVNADGWDVEPCVLTRVEPSGAGWEIDREPGWGTFWLQEKNAKGVVPKVGDSAVFYMSNMSIVRGLEINGQRLFYATRTQADRDARRSEERRHAKAQRELDETREDRDRRRKALPSSLQARLARYETANPLWRRDYETYELFVCEQAANLAALPKAGDIKAWYDRFRDLKFEDQKRAWPGLDDGHSGNTFGAAVQLAYWLDQGWSEQIINGHGAMVALVGCADYGCHSAPTQVAS